MVSCKSLLVKELEKCMTRYMNLFIFFKVNSVMNLGSNLLNVSQIL